MKVSFEYGIWSYADLVAEDASADKSGVDASLLVKYLGIAAFVYVLWRVMGKPRDRGAIVILLLVAHLLVYATRQAQECDDLYEWLGRDDAKFEELAPGCIPDPGDKDPHN